MRTELELEELIVPMQQGANRIITMLRSVNTYFFDECLNTSPKQSLYSPCMAANLGVFAVYNEIALDYAMKLEDKIEAVGGLVTQLLNERHGQQSRM